VHFFVYFHWDLEILEVYVFVIVIISYFVFTIFVYAVVLFAVILIFVGSFCAWSVSKF
jgi:hypothetical protein